eukprot:3803298-Amphidinium_carterae.2
MCPLRDDCEGGERFAEDTHSENSTIYDEMVALAAVRHASGPCSGVQQVVLVAEQLLHSPRLLLKITAWSQDVVGLQQHKRHS